MAQPQLKRMTADEFLVWHLTQEGKYDLVDGIPVPHRAMAGGTEKHSTIAGNILGHLFAKLRGTLCRPHGSDLAIRTAIDQVRYPEVSVQCGPGSPNGYEVTNPVALFEVLSPSTRRTDEVFKLPEYLRHPKLRTLVFIDPERMDVVVHTRADAGEWQTSRITKPTDLIKVAGTEAELTLMDVYDGVPLAPLAANG